MAKHDVSVKLPAVSIAGESDVVFKIKLDGHMFGALTVKKDSLVWRPAHAASETLEVTWTEFDEWMRARKTLKS